MAKKIRIYRSCDPILRFSASHKKKQQAALKKEQERRAEAEAESRSRIICTQTLGYLLYILVGDEKPTQLYRDYNKPK